MKQFASSSSANLVTLVVIFVIYIFKKKCEHSKCHLKNSCIDIELSNTEEDNNNNDEFFRKVKEAMSSLQIEHSKSLRKKPETTLSNV